MYFVTCVSSECCYQFVRDACFKYLCLLFRSKLADFFVHLAIELTNLLSIVIRNDKHRS